MQLKIWSAETGQCPVTLKGHTGSIMDIAIVDRGRNVVSVSKYVCVLTKIIDAASFKFIDLIA